MGLMSVGGGKTFSFKEATIKIYKIGLIQAGVIMAQSSFQVNATPVGQYIRNSDLNFYAAKDGMFLIIEANSSLTFKTQIKHFSSGELMHTIDRNGEGVVILAL